MMFKNKIKQIKPISKGLYAWNCMHAGSFLLFVETLQNCYKFLFLPGPSDYYLTFEDFEICMNSNALEFVEALPDDIYNESINLALSCPVSAHRIIPNENIKQKKIKPISQEHCNR